MVGKGIALSSGGNTQAALNMFAAAADAAPAELQPQIRDIAAIYTSEPTPAASDAPVEDLGAEDEPAASNTTPAPEPTAAVE